MLLDVQHRIASCWPHPKVQQTGNPCRQKGVSGCQLSNANDGRNESEVLIFKKSISNEFGKDLEQNHWD